jgi:Bax protein
LFIVLLTIAGCSNPPVRHEIVKPSTVSADDIITNKDIPQGHKEFIAGFLPDIHSSNNSILVLRNKILEFRDSLDRYGRLNASQIRGLNRTLFNYKLDNRTIKENTTGEQLRMTIDELLKRVDIIPVKLVMAQAIIESGWGSSKFAREGNNYFGIHCYTPGCGMEPEGLDSAEFFVKTYPNIKAGIVNYLWVLNTGNAFRGLRTSRQEMRAEGIALDPFVLVQKLTAYSTKRGEYIDMVDEIMRDYLPGNTEELLVGGKD